MFCQSNDFFYSCHRISKLSYLFNIGLWFSPVDIALPVAFLTYLGR
jgi:hypothetical protein